MITVKGKKFMNENSNVEDLVSINLVEDTKLISMYQEVETFIKFLEEEIKKTDVGDEDGE